MAVSITEFERVDGQWVGKNATKFEGAVLNTWEHNGYNDSDFYATVWNEEEGEIQDVEYDTTRFAGGGYAKIDATPEVREKANKYRYECEVERLKSIATLEAKEPEVGKAVKVIGGRKYKGLEGKVFWKGVDQWKTTRWFTVYSIGVQTSDGQRFFVPGSYLEVTDPENWLPSLSEIEEKAKHIRKF